jgi:hypothetical protein
VGLGVGLELTGLDEAMVGYGTEEDWGAGRELPADGFGVDEAGTELAPDGVIVGPAGTVTV